MSLTGRANISESSTEYQTVQTVTAGDKELTVKGNGEEVYVAEWNEGEYSYTMTFDEATDVQVAAKMIQKID